MDSARSRKFRSSSFIDVILLGISRPAAGLFEGHHVSQALFKTRGRSEALCAITFRYAGTVVADRELDPAVDVGGARLSASTISRSENCRYRSPEWRFSTNSFLLRACPS